MWKRNPLLEDKRIEAFDEKISGTFIGVSNLLILSNFLMDLVTH